MTTLLWFARSQIPYVKSVHLQNDVNQPITFSAKFWLKQRTIIRDYRLNSRRSKKGTMRRKRKRALPKVDKVREIKIDELWWPDKRQASRGLGGNLEYRDLRDQSWEDANRILTFEEELVHRIEDSADPEATYEEILDELYDDDEGLLRLDIGVAGVVLSLSVAGCIPFTSCNGGIYGGHHHEHYPLVGFYMRPEFAPMLLKAATKADTSVTSDGVVFVFSDNVKSMIRFARSLLGHLLRL